tara:strand:+ start:5421 stop:7013 length:1593 start_codon:yes stop_codon:yes gene_type:complete
MAITSSGQVSFADINTELGRASDSHCGLGEQDVGALLGSRGVKNYWNSNSHLLTGYSQYQPQYEKDKQYTSSSHPQWLIDNENDETGFGVTRVYPLGQQVAASYLYDNYRPYSRVWAYPNNFYSPTSKALKPLFVFDAATEGAYRQGNHPQLNTLNTSQYPWTESNTLLASMYKKAGADESSMSNADHSASSDYWKPAPNYANTHNTSYSSGTYNSYDNRNAGRGQWITGNTSNPYPRTQLKSYTRPRTTFPGTTYCMRLRGLPYFQPYWKRFYPQLSTYSSGGSYFQTVYNNAFGNNQYPQDCNGNGDPSQEICNTGGWTVAMAFRLLSTRGTTDTWTRPFIIWGSGISEYANIGWYVYNPNGYNVWYCGSMYYNQSQYSNQYGYSTWPSGASGYGSIQDIWWIRVFSFSGSYQRATSSSSGGGSVTGNVTEIIKTSATGSFTNLSNYVNIRSQSYNGTSQNAKISGGSYNNSNYRWSPQWGPSYWNTWSGISNECYDLMHLSMYTHPMSSARRYELCQNLAAEYIGGY